MAVRPEHTFRFISGLPRSGSTLLAAILRQNPRFAAGMTSPVGGLFQGLVAQVSAGSEFAPVVTIEQRRRLLRGLFDSFYADVAAEVVFDTNRLWTSQLDALVDLFPDARVLCTVRDVAWVMDSLERQYRNNAFENTRLFSTPAERDTVYSRTETLAHRNRLVGFAYSALREACWGEHADRLLIIEYELLSRAPERVVELIYQFLGEPAFAHDYQDVEYDAPEFDAQLGLRGLHRIRPQVEHRARRTVLPPDLFERFSGMAFWRELEGSKAHIIAAQQPRERTSTGLEDTRERAE
jgi:sulfotransferase